jgi:hypothetical protein
VKPEKSKPFRSIGGLMKQQPPKELRHTTASLMHRKGVPVLVIKDQLRHTNVKTTVDFYIDADVDYQTEMIAKLILNSEKNGVMRRGKEKGLKSPSLPSKRGPSPFFK